jgi:hypothetical protein
MALPLPLSISPSIAAMNSAPAERRPSSRAAIPSLAGLIRKIGPQPPYSALVGLCEDGLPFLLDLSDPVPGAVLIAGDPSSGKTRLLQSLLASVGVFSGPQELSYTLITSRPQENALLQDSLTAWASGSANARQSNWCLIMPGSPTSADRREMALSLQHR